jgi:hypothetical protein
MLDGSAFALMRLYNIHCATTLEEQLLNSIASLSVANLSFTYMTGRNKTLRLGFFQS